MFVGTYQHTIDEKGRLTLPAKWRSELESGVFVTPGVEKCLFIFTQSKFEAMAKEIEEQGFERADARAWARHFAGMATDAEPDKQGRILIPQTLRDFAELDSEVTIIGVVSRIEVWNPKMHKEFEEGIEANVPGVAERMGTLIHGMAK